MRTTTKEIAAAFENGLRLAYGKKLRGPVRKQLYEMLDDMSLALAKRAVQMRDEQMKKSSWIVSAICDDLDLDLP